VKLALLLLAAGRSSRFGGEVPKVYLPLAGVPVLLRSAERLRRVVPAGADGRLVVLVAPADRAHHLPPLLPALTSLGAEVADGGDCRQQSMQRGLDAAGPCDLVLVHDAARPLFPIDAARRCIERAAAVGAALLALPATDTLKRAGPDGLVQGTLDRRSIWCAQTPQVVRRELLVRALQRAAGESFDATDDVGLVEAIGGRVALVEGSPRNVKITRPDDLAIAEALFGLERESP